MARTAGTAALTAAYKLEHRLRPGVKGPVDYDDSLVPGMIVAATSCTCPPSPEARKRSSGLALRWSYGSVFCIWHGILRRRFAEPWASVLFGSTLMSATFSLFPCLAYMPPPWRWPRGYLATKSVYACCLRDHARGR